MFNTRYSKILHDPECQNNCCYKSFGQPMQADNFTDMHQLANVQASYSNESSRTPNICDGQILHFVNTSNNQPHLFQEVLSETLVDDFGMSYSELCYRKPIGNPRRDSSFTNIRTLEEQGKQRSHCKGITKRKRKRTVFTTEQIVAMEGVFKKRPYVSREERVILTQRLNLSEQAIKIWFQNRRRVTEKREREIDQSDSSHSDSAVEEVCNDYTTRLDYIESHINQNTDEYGFVTLDNRSLTELVKIIDSVLSYSIHCHNDQCENKSNESYLMYEPVSPDSSVDDNKESEYLLKWEPSEPEESLQRLIDIQALLHS